MGSCPRDRGPDGQYLGFIFYPGGGLSTVGS